MLPLTLKCVLCKGLPSCEVLGLFVTDLGLATDRIYRLEAEREQLLEACLVLHGESAAMRSELDELRAERH